MPAFQGNAEPCVRQDFTDNTFKFNEIFLGQNGTLL